MKFIQLSSFETGLLGSKGVSKPRVVGGAIEGADFHVDVLLNDVFVVDVVPGKKSEFEIHNLASRS